MTAGYGRLQGVARSLRQGVTRGYNGLQEVMGGYRGLQEVIGGCKGLHGFARGYMVYKRLVGLSWGYRVL